MSDYDNYRITNRHLSESDCRDAYSNRTGVDPYELDKSIWNARERRNEYYDRMDNGDSHE